MGTLLDAQHIVAGEGRPAIAVIPSVLRQRHQAVHLSRQRDGPSQARDLLSQPLNQLRANAALYKRKIDQNLC